MGIGLSKKMSSWPQIETRARFTLPAGSGPEPS